MSPPLPVESPSRMEGAEFGQVSPLPLRVVEDEGQRLGRRCAQRRKRKVHRAKDFNGVVSALNWMAGFTDASSVAEPTPEQAGVHALIYDRLDSLLSSKEAIPDQQASLRAMLHGNSVYDGVASQANLANFSKVASVSLPTTLDGTRFVGELVPDDSRHFLEQSYERMLRPSAEVEADDRLLGPIKPYWDPVLAKRARNS